MSLASDKLTQWGITRDSVMWFWGKLTGTVLFLASMGTEITHYGIPLNWVHGIQLAGLWLTYFSAQQSTSKLKGDPTLPVTPDVHN